LLAAQVDGVLPASAALLAARDVLVRRQQDGCSALRECPGWSTCLLPVCCQPKHLEAHVTAGLSSRQGQRLSRHRGTRAGHLPAVRFPPERDGLGGASQRTVDADAPTANRGEAEDAAVQDRAVAVRRRGEGVRAVGALAAGRAGCLSLRGTPQAGVLGPL